MKVITRYGWFGPGGHMVRRLEPWTTPQYCDDGLLDVLPSKMIIVEPPAGYRFKDGIKYDNGEFVPGIPFDGQPRKAARWPTKADLSLIHISEPTRPY